MNILTRRRFVAGAAATACVFPASGQAAVTQSRLDRIDRTSKSTTEFMVRKFPITRDMVANATGYLIIPVMTQAAFGIGGAIGDGLLKIGGKTAGYYSAVQFTYGIQFSAQQFSQALFFLQQSALDSFYEARGWTVGADAGIVILNDAEGIDVDTLTDRADIAGLIFGQAGLHIGASLKGTKYTRIA